MSTTAIEKPTEENYSLETLRTDQPQVFIDRWTYDRSFFASMSDSDIITALQKRKSEVWKLIAGGEHGIGIRAEFEVLCEYLGEDEG